MSRIFEKGEAPSNFIKTFIKHIYKKGDESECDNYRGMSFVSVGSKLHSMMILLRLEML